MVFTHTVDLQTTSHCSRPIDPPPEDLLPEYITIEELGKILEGGSQIQPNTTPTEQRVQQNYLNCSEFKPAPVHSTHISSIQSKNPVVEIDLTEDDCAEVENIEEESTSICEKAQSVRSSCSESELLIDISEHDVCMSLNEQDLNQLTSQSYKAQFQCETCPYETDVKEHFEVHLKVHRTVFACDWCRYITKSKFKLKNHQIKRHKSLMSHLMINCLYCDISTRTEQGMKKHLLNIHQKCFNRNKKKSEAKTLPEMDEVSRSESPYSEPRLQIDLGDSDEHPQSNCNNSEVQEGEVLSEQSTNNPILELADIKVKHTEELVKTTDTTQLTSQIKKAQFQCDICLYESDFQDQFEVHQKVHRKVYACPLCKYRTCSQFKLTRHQYKCPNSQPKVDFECPSSRKCAFTTPVIADLEEHWLSTHHYAAKNQKKYNDQLALKASARFRCKTCHKRLDSETTVEEHMWKHTFIRTMKNSNKLKCPKCDYVDRFPHVMRNHYKAIHQVNESLVTPTSYCCLIVIFIRVVLTMIPIMWKSCS